MYLSFYVANNNNIYFLIYSHYLFERPPLNGFPTQIYANSILTFNFTEISLNIIIQFPIFFTPQCPDLLCSPSGLSAGYQGLFPGGGGWSGWSVKLTTRLRLVPIEVVELYFFTPIRLYADHSGRAV
jgi:hypothetical protein